MNYKLKTILTSWQVVLLMVCLLFALISLFSISPQLWGGEGLTIRSVVTNSSATLAGIENPSPRLTPLARERIFSLDGEKITSVSQYYDLIASLEENETVKLETSKQIYTLLTKVGEEGKVDLGLKVYPAPTTNLRKGLDLEGGTRVLLEPAEEISSDDLEMTLSNLKERLNVYGLSDVSVRVSSDLVGSKFILIEIAGVTEEEVKELLAKQGKFEAKIGNQTVFFGGKKDITYVCRSADCSGIDPHKGCGKSGKGYACGFFFAITLSPEAAERQAILTKELTVVAEEGGNYLSEELVLFLDDKEVDRLKIGAELKGRATTDIQISGGGMGISQQEALTNTLLNMKRLQTIIFTGSLPVKLNIVKMDTISPSLGQEFVSNVLLVGVGALLVVVFIIILRYRKLKIILPLVLTMVSEMMMILGFAALVGWNLDLAAIAAIIIIAGTGVDHFIIITDETQRQESQVLNWKQKIKNAMSIVFGAYFTVLAGMLPLWFAGAGLLRGFAFTTIAGLSFGVLIARPAYAKMIEILLKE